jgi:hypothetical protein
LLPVSNILHKKRQELENEYERIAGKRWRQWKYQRSIKKF